MDQIKTFEERLAAGEFMTLEDAAKFSGYSAQYLSRLCHARKVEHAARGKRYFFTREQAEALIKTVKAEG